MISPTQGRPLGGAQIIRKLAAGRNVTVGAMVAHFVAKYDRDTVSAFVTKLYGEPGKGAALDSFHCTDSIPRVTGWLEEELRPRLAEGLPRKAHLVSLAPVVADWVATHPPRAARSRGPASCSPRQSAHVR